MFASALLGSLLSVGGATSSPAWARDNQFLISVLWKGLPREEMGEPPSLEVFKVFMALRAMV